MRNSPLKGLMRKGNSQGLNPEALADKRARDLAAAKTPARKMKKAQNQREVQRSNSDIHHKSDGSIQRVSIKNNRGFYGDGTKNEG
jgi:hypothetical protein